MIPYPEWKDAPKWANWLTQDSNGEWFWWEIKHAIYSVNKYIKELNK